MRTHTAAVSSTGDYVAKEEEKVSATFFCRPLRY